MSIVSIGNGLFARTRDGAPKRKMFSTPLPPTSGSLRSALTANPTKVPVSARKPSLEELDRQ